MPYFSVHLFGPTLFSIFIAYVSSLSVRDLRSSPGKHKLAEALPRITVVSMFSGDAIDEWIKARNNHIEYCMMHGYTYFAPHTDEESSKYLRGRRGGWAKVTVIQEYFTKVAEGSYVFFTDGDSLFMDKDRSLQNFIHEEKDFVLAGDANGLNTGHFLIRNTQWSRDLLADVWNIYPALGFQYEQSSFIAMFGGADADDQTTWAPSFNKLNLRRCVTEWDAGDYESHLSPDMQANVAVLKQSSMNSNVVLPGIFIYHIAGGFRAHEKTAIIDRYANLYSESSYTRAALACITFEPIKPENAREVLMAEEACLNQQKLLKALD